MNRKFFVSALSVLFLGGSAAVAQDKPMEKTDVKKVTTTSGTMKSKAHEVVGTVKEYEAGKKIKVLVGKKTRSFTLDSKSVNTTVEPSVAVGQQSRRQRLLQRNVGLGRVDRLRALVRSLFGGSGQSRTSSDRS